MELGTQRINQEEHLEYILKKEQRTLSLWDVIMHRSATWSDFSDSEKPMTVKTDSSSSQQTKSTEDESTTNKNIKFKNPVKPAKKNEKWFPGGRIQD